MITVIRKLAVPVAWAGLTLIATYLVFLGGGFPAIYSIPLRLVNEALLVVIIGAFLLAAGAKGKRYVLPNSEVMLHQVIGGAEGQATDIKIRAEHILKLHSRLNGILAKHTGQPVAKIEKDTDRDFFMTAEEAVGYGLVDKIIE